MIRNVIFDWSGTLVDDLPAVWEATNYVFKQAGLPEMTLERFRGEFCLPFTRFYDKHAPNVSFDQLEDWFHGHFRQCQASVVPLPHAREFLHFCHGSGLRTFVLSSVHSDHYQLQAEATGFAPLIQKAYVGVRDKREKIHAILEEHQIDPRETIFIGDMQHDIETAQHGGVHSCAVLTGYNSLLQLRASKPDIIVEHLGELRELFLRQSFELTTEGPRDLTPIVTVGALIFHPEKAEVLMVRTHKWSGLWGIPGGKVRAGETCELALIRELKEETNLDVDSIRFVMVQDCIESQEFYRPAHFVLLNYTCRARGPMSVRLNDEAQEYRWLKIDEAMQLELNTPTRVLLKAVAELTR